MDKQYLYIAGALGGAWYGHRKYGSDSYKVLLSSIIGATITYAALGFVTQQYQLFKVNQSLKNANQGA